MERSSSDRSYKDYSVSLAMILFVVLTISCKKRSTNCGLECIYQPNDLAFNFGFENVSLVQTGNNAHITGVDTAFTSNNNWGDYIDNDQGNLNINYEDGSISERIAEIVRDPQDPTNSVLHFNITSPNVYKGKKPEKARIQLQYHNTQCVKEYYQSCRIFLPKSNMEHLRQDDDLIYWLSIFEFWNNGNWTGEKYPFRITVGLWKDQGSGADIVFQVKGEKDKKLGGFEDLWHEKTDNYPVPFGKWFELEMYLQEGDANNGRFYLAIIPEGGSKTVLFDIHNYTQHPKEKCPDGFTHIHPLKWYTSKEVVDHMKSGGYGLEIFWDDLVVYRNKKPQ